MTTKDVLKKIEGVHYTYLKTLADTSKNAAKEGLRYVSEHCDIEANGYIRCLVNCEAIEQKEFRILLAWYNLVSR